MRVKTIVLLLAGIGLLSVWACKKEYKQACNDERALNLYADEDYESDDTCKFSEVVFFMMPDSVHIGNDTAYTYDSIVKYDTTIAAIDTATNDTTYAYDSTLTVDTIVDVTPIYEPFDENVLPLVVYVDGDSVGTLLNASPVFPNNCDTALPENLYITGKLTDGEEHTWLAVSGYKNLVFSGTFRANPSLSCIPVRIK